MNKKAIFVTILVAILALAIGVTLGYAQTDTREVFPDFYLMDGSSIEGAVWLGDASGGYIAEAYYDDGEMLLSTPRHFCPCGEACE